MHSSGLLVDLFLIHAAAGHFVLFSVVVSSDKFKKEILNSVCNIHLYAQFSKSCTARQATMLQILPMHIGKV